MAINKKLIHFKNKTKFDEELAKNNINDASICFIKDTQQIWTHGQLYSCNVDVSTLSDVLRVDSESILNKDRITVSGEYTNDYGNVISYSYGNSDQGLLLTNTYTTQEALETHVFTVDNGIKLGTIKSYDKQDPDNTTHATASGIYVGEGSITLHNIEVGQDQYVQIFCTMHEGNFYVQRAVEGSENGTPISIVSLTEAGVQLASGFANSEQSQSLSITPEGIFLNGQHLNKYISTSYNNLKTLRDNAHLVPGAMYRITDYVCTTTLPDTASAHHPFDIVVTAISNHALSEEASVVLHEGDTYFANSNLSAWKVWYTLDNDLSRFNWADEENGKGIIYRMIDDKNNDLPYDFKNILFIENNYIYEVNELGNSVSLDNPLEISYTLLADTDEEYNTKDDVIVEINQSDETPDKVGQDVWVLYKTDLGDYQEEGVDYADMFVFVDKYDYNGQTWDRWRKAEYDEDAWHWVTHEGSSVCILTEQLLDVTGNNPIYRYTFNLEEFLGDLSQADASIVAKDSESEKGIRNNYMQSCYIDYNGIGTSEYSLPINVFKITNKDWFNIYGNHFSGLYTYNIFEGEQFAVNRFDPVCSVNTFTDLTMGTFGSYFCGNILGFSNIISCGMYNMSNTLGGTSLTLGDYVLDCKVNGWSLTVAANTGGCVISGNNAIISSINGLDERKIIEIPDSEYTLKVAQNSLGEIKIYNEADLIA